MPISPTRDLNQIPIFTTRTRITILLIGVQHDSTSDGEHFSAAHIDDLDGRVN
jgi:hypothetical protein